MKKVIIIIMIVLIITGCKSGSKPENIIINKYQGDTANNITLNIKEGTLTPTSAVVIIKDNSGVKNAYTNGFGLYKKQNSDWIQLDFINDNIVITTENHFVDENNTLEFKINWENSFGVLSPGEYKLVKYATNLENNKISYFSTDFIIE